MALDGGYVLRVRLNVSLPCLPREVAHALVDGGRQICPYSKATRGNIEVAINLAQAEPERQNGDPARALRADGIRTS
jgi:hypothetical protein